MACCSRRLSRDFPTSSSLTEVSSFSAWTFLITRDIEFREHFEGRFEGQRLALVQMEIYDLWLRDRCQVLFCGFLAQEARQEGLQQFLVDVLGETLFHDGGRHFAFAEARDLRVSRVLGEDGLALFLNRLRGNLDGDLA